MNKEHEAAPLPNAEDKNKADARTAFLLAVIFGGLIVASIAGMLIFDMYGERHANVMNAPADAADR
jgi:hypothetical protein